MTQITHHVNLMIDKYVYRSGSQKGKGNPLDISIYQVGADSIPRVESWRALLTGIFASRDVRSLTFRRMAVRTDSQIGDKRRELLDLLDKARAEIHKEILGQEELIDTTLLCLIIPGRRHNEPFGGNLIIEGAHGLGKTKLVKTLGQVLNLSFSRIQFTADLNPSDITGSEVWLPERGEYKFIPGPLFANILLADEITRTSGRIQSAMFEAMEERTVTVGEITHKLPLPFFVFATTNIAEEVGSVLYELPVGEYDRFFMSIRVDPLTEVLERRLYAWDSDEPQSTIEHHEAGTSGVLGPEVLEEISRFISDHYPIPLDSPLNVFITDLVRATRRDESVQYGATHRAGLDLRRAAQATAFLSDTDMVTEEHVLAVFKGVMRHRIIPKFTREQGHQHTGRRGMEEFLDRIITQTPLFRR